MKTREQIQERIDTLDAVIKFASVIRIDSVAVSNLKSFIEILQWVISDVA